jgi:hypothetical protein
MSTERPELQGSEERKISLIRNPFGPEEKQQCVCSLSALC